jgi:DNA excision repair protein ERCC-4
MPQETNSALLLVREKTRVVVDHRERPSGIIELLTQFDDILVTIETLRIGDYCVDGMVLVERKTAADFAQSLFDGRLFSQARRLANSHLRAAYIIEGTGQEWSGLGVSRNALQGALITLMLIFDIPVFRSTDPIESAALIHFIGSQLIRQRDPGYASYRQPKAKRKKKRQLRVLQSLPGIGPYRAKRLLERFKTVRACFCAVPAEIAKVEGIGSKTAEAIDEVIN